MLLDVAIDKDVDLKEGWQSVDREGRKDNV